MKKISSKYDSERAILIQIEEEIAKLLNKPREMVNFDASFLELGIDSILGVELVEAINKAIGIELGPEAIFDYRGVAELASHIAQTHKFETGKQVVTPHDDTETPADLPAKETVPDIAHPVEDVNGNKKDIAIIGISGRFPDSGNVEEFWTHLQEGHCCIKEINRSGWKESEYYDPDPAKENKAVSKWGGLLEDIERFDPLFFNISPREAERMDPQQRLFLEEAFKAFEDGGYSMEKLSGKKVGVFVGVHSTDYREKILSHEEIKSQTFLGNDMAILTARVSYFLNLKGPSLAIDTACSSSLAAIHMAYESVRHDECEMALAGGVFVMSSPRFYIMVSKTDVLAADGRCKTFDDSANGIVIGEGVGALLLKPLENAFKDHDHIYGVIKGSAINQDGRTKGITAPSTLSQADLICEAYTKAQINPETITYIEAHGTGTKLGDPIEIKALTKAFGTFTHKKQFCAIGSCKPNIGHSITTSGAAGVIKVLMGMKYKKIPPLINLETVNRHIDFENSPFYINTTLHDWENQGGHPLRAGVSSFGFSGTNCHLIIQEAPPSIPANPADKKRPYYFIPFSARTEEALQRKSQDLAAWLDDAGEKYSMADIGYTLHMGRSHFLFRVALVVKDIRDLRTKLAEISDKRTTADYIVGQEGEEKTRQRHILKELGKRLISELQECGGIDDESFKERLLALADLYVAGYDLDWEMLYQKANYSRISLPTYPFSASGDQYWTGGISKKREWEECDSLFYLPGWKPVNCPIKTVKKPPGKKRVLVVYSSPELAFLKVLLEAHARDEVIRLEKGLPGNSGIDQFIRDMGDVQLIYFLGGLQEEDAAVDDLDALDRSQDRGVFFLFHLVKALSNQGHAHKSFQVKVITNDVYHLEGNGVIKPYAASLHGMIQSMVKEYPYWEISCIDVSLEGIKPGPLGMEALVKHVMDEPGNSRGEVVLIRDGKRYVRTITPLRLPMVNQAPFRTRGVYVILGGAGGIGLELGRYLSSTVQARLVLIDRQPRHQLDLAQEQKISAIEANGGKVLYVSADAANLQQMTHAVKEAKHHFKRINGVFHSAMVLKDKLLENMDEKTFRMAFDIKVRGSVVLYKTFKEEKLDFMMFFSSIQSFTGNAGQCNYGAGCTFKDAFVYYLSRKMSCVVRNINWGFWGSVGAVSGGAYHKILTEQGIWPIAVQEGMEAIQRVLSSSVTRVIMIRAEKRMLESIGVDLNHRLELYPTQMPSILETAIEQTKKPTIDSRVVSNLEKSYGELENFYRHLLLVAFQKMGVFQGQDERYSHQALKERLKLIPGYSRLYHVLLDILTRAGYVRLEGEKVLTNSILGTPGFIAELKNLEKKKKRLESQPGIKAYVNLLWACLGNLPGILRGESRPTSVMFPNSSMDLVEGVYRGNKVADYYNDLTAWSLVSYIKARLPQLKKDEKIRILEVGAGTGGTSVPVFEKIRTYGDKLYYAYTDISLGFSQYGRKHYGEENPFVDFKVLNIEKGLKEQGYKPGDFDVVIATNVLHATRSIKNTLSNVKMLLKTNGWLILNELTDLKDYISLTFGLLDGWWLFEEDDYRLPGSPLIGTEMWKILFKEMGFSRVIILGHPEPGGIMGGQHVIIAESNGQVIRQAQVKTVKRVQVVDREVEPQPVTPQPGTRDQVEEKIIEILSTVLQIDKTQIKPGLTYNEIGVDSILAAEIVQRMNEHLGIHLKPTDLFNYSTIDKLAAHIENEFGDIVRHRSEVNIEPVPGIGLTIGEGCRKPITAAEVGKDPGRKADEKTKLHEVLIESGLESGSPFSKRVLADGRKNRQCLPGEVEEEILESLFSVLRIDKTEFDPDTPYRDFGVDSVSAAEIINRINEGLGTHLQCIDLFNYSTIKQLTDYIVGSFNDSFPVRVEIGDKRQSKKELLEGEKIAVIGIAARFPGAGNIDEFWQSLIDGKDFVSKITRWDVEQYYDPDPQVPGKSYTKWGGFLSGIDRFDPLFFNISPHEAEWMDPQQRLFLEEAWKALEDAAYPDRQLDGKRCGVFVGINFSDYQRLFEENNLTMDAYSFMGNADALVSARISYFLNLKGPAVTINTACSSSLTAVHLACESIRCGSSEIAIAGGVQLINTPEIYIKACKTGMLSPTGLCKTFDNAADGFIPGEGVGAVVLKPLAAALEHGDHIYAVIVASGTNQDGKSSGITAPSGPSQTQLVCDVYNHYHIDPETIAYVETHGTGTKLGDPIEIDALTNAFRKYTSKKQYCAIGSVKTNIGHSLAAAGAAGFIKTSLCLKHKKLVPSLNFEKENELIDFQGSPFYVNTCLQDWQTRDGIPRTAAVSAFGFSGTNAHVVLQEAPLSVPLPIEQSSRTPPYYLIPISGKTPSTLEQKWKDLWEWLQNQGEAHQLKNISYTLLNGRSHFVYRSLLVVENTCSAIDLAKKIHALLQGNEVEHYLTNLRTVVPGTRFKPDPNLIQKGETLIKKLQETQYPSPKYKEELLTLADLYIQQYDLDWHCLYNGQDCCRISLPTYPFARDRFWISANETGIAPAGINTPLPPVNKLHPLIHANTSTLREQKYTTLLTGSEFYLEDHVVARQAVFPGAAYIEMARAAGQMAGEAKVWKIKNVIWEKPITVGDGYMSIYTRLYPGSNDRMVDVEISTPGQGEQRVINARARLVYENHSATESDEPGDKNGRIDIEAIKKRCTNLMKGEHCYSLFLEAGLNYGPSFRTLKKLYANEDGSEALSYLELPRQHEKEFKNFHLYPPLIDGALQTLIGLEGIEEKSPDNPNIPFSLGEVEIVKPLTQKCYAYAQWAGNRHTRGSKSRVKRFNLQLVDEAGHVLVKMKDFFIRKLSANNSFEPTTQYKTEKEIKDDQLLEILKKVKCGELGILEADQMLEKAL